MQSLSKSKFDIDMALDTIDYSFPWYRPTEEALEFFNLMRLVQGKDFEFSTPMAHYFMIDVIFGNVNVKQFPYSEEVKKQIIVNTKRVAVMASRGLAKSSVITAFLPVYLAVKGTLPKYGKVYFMVAIAASAQGGGRVISKSIQSLCQDSTFCNNYFSDMRFTETESEFTRKGEGSLDDRTFLVRTMGYSGGIRGTRSNIGAHRPDILAFDDTILNTSAAYSKTQMDSLEEIIFSDAENALVGGGKGRIYHVFTPFHMADPNVKMLTSGAYTPIVLPICENIDESTKKKDFKGAWTAMHPFEAVQAQYKAAKASNKVQSFMQERMLRITSEEERMVPEYLIKTYPSRGAIMANIENFNLLITTDFTASNSLEGDFSGIALWAISQNDEKYLLDLWLQKCTIQDQFEALFKMIEKWSKWGKGAPIEVGVEIDGQQQVNIFALDKMKIEKNIWFNYARQKGKGAGQVGIRSRKEAGGKVDRFRAILPEFEMGRIKFPEDIMETPAMIEMMDELRKASHSGFGSLHDDGLDLISQIGMIEYYTPTGDAVVAKDTLDMQGNSIWGAMLDDEDDEGSNPLIF